MIQLFLKISKVVLIVLLVLGNGMARPPGYGTWTSYWCDATQISNVTITSAGFSCDIWNKNAYDAVPLDQIMFVAKERGMLWDATVLRFSPQGLLDPQSGIHISNLTIGAADYVKIYFAGTLKETVVL